MSKIKKAKTALSEAELVISSLIEGFFILLIVLVMMFLFQYVLHLKI